MFSSYFFTKEHSKCKDEYISFMIKLGNYCSHKIVTKEPDLNLLISTDREIYATDFLESLDRFELDYPTFYAMSLKPSSRSYLIKEISKYIDYRIPFFYFIKTNGHDNTSGKVHYKGVKDSPPHFKYHFDSNYSVESQMLSTPLTGEERAITIPQSKFLNSLLSKHSLALKCDINDLTLDEASHLIAFINDDTELPSGMFDEFLTYS